MGIISNYIDKRIQKLSDDSVDIVTNVDVPLFTRDGRNIYKRLLESEAWYSSDESALRYFYKNVAPRFRVGNAYENDDLNYFWEGAPTDIRKVNSGFATMISNTMSNILFSNGLQETGLEEDEQERLEEIKKDNKMMLAFQGGATTESWAGYTVAKIVVDTDLTQYPILKFTDPKNVKIVAKHGRVQEYRFILEKQTNKKGAFYLYEIYGWNKGIGAFIKYSCVFEDLKGIQQDRPISDMGKDEEDYQEQIFAGMIRPLAFYKPNKLPNNEVTNSLLGASDYSGSYSELDGLDEATSIWADDIRNGRTIFRVPESLVGKNLNGENQAWERFTNNMVVTKDNVAALKGEVIDEITKLNPDVDVDKYIETIKNQTNIILRNVGLSPVTVGIDDKAGANASSEARKDMERQTIKTRDSKTKLWKPFIEDIYDTLLQVDDYINNSTIGTYESNVTFNPYIDSTVEERISTAGTAATSGVLSTEAQVEYIYRDSKTEDEKELEVQRLKVENNITIATQE